MYRSFQYSNITLSIQTKPNLALSAGHTNPQIHNMLSALSDNADNILNQ